MLAVSPFYSQEGRISFEVKFDTTGNIIDVVFIEMNQFHMAEEAKKELSVKIGEQIKFNIAEDAKKWYGIKPIILKLTVLGRSLKNYKPSHK